MGKIPFKAILASAFLSASCLFSLAVQSADKLTVLLDWFINPDHATFIVAEKMGFFREANLEITMIEPADPNDPPKLVAAGRADLGLSYQPQLHLHAAQGLPLSRIATVVATPLNTLVVLKEGPIKTIADLKGRKVGFSIGGFEDAILGAMLEKYGLSIEEVDLVNVNFSLSPSLIAGKVDAVIGAYRNFELNQMEIVGKPGRAFYVEEEGVPSYDELILIANHKDLNQPALAAFVKALERSVQYLVNHPQQAWQLFKSYKTGLDDELNRRAWRDTLSRFALRPGALDIARYERFAQFVLERGLVKKMPPVDTYTTVLR